MCRKKKCGHDVMDLCSCEPVREGNIAEMFPHFFHNIVDEAWELDYTDLGHPEYRRLCLVGVCRQCGGRLCLDIGSSNGLAGSDFIVDTYQRLYQIYHSGWRRMPDQEFWDRFIQLFHELDRPTVLDWKSWLEEQYKEETV